MWSYNFNVSLLWQLNTGCLVCVWRLLRVEVVDARNMLKIPRVVKTHLFKNAAFCWWNVGWQFAVDECLIIEYCMAGGILGISTRCVSCTCLRQHGGQRCQLAKSYWHVERKQSHWYDTSWSVLESHTAITTRDRMNWPPLFPDRISNCANLFRLEPNRTELCS